MDNCKGGLPFHKKRKRKSRDEAEVTLAPFPPTGGAATSVSASTFSIQRLGSGSSESDEALQGLGGLVPDAPGRTPTAFPPPHHFTKLHDEAIDVVGIGDGGMHRVTS